MKHLATLATLAVLLLSACHSSRSLPSPSDAPAPAPAAPATVFSVTNFNAEVEGIRTTGQLRMASDSVLWVAVYKLFELGRAKATRDSVWFNAPLAGRRFAGTYADLEKVINRHLDFATLQDLLTGDDPSALLSRFAAELGVKASVSLGTPRFVDHIEFPLPPQ